MMEFPYRLRCNKTLYLPFYHAQICMSLVYATSFAKRENLCLNTLKKRKTTNCKTNNSTSDDRPANVRFVYKKTAIFTA